MLATVPASAEYGLAMCNAMLGHTLGSHDALANHASPAMTSPFASTCFAVRRCISAHGMAIYHNGCV